MDLSKVIRELEKVRDKLKQDIDIVERFIVLINPPEVDEKDFEPYPDLSLDHLKTPHWMINPDKPWDLYEHLDDPYIPPSMQEYLDKQEEPKKYHSFDDDADREFNETPMQTRARRRDAVLANMSVQKEKIMYVIAERAPGGASYKMVKGPWSTPQGCKTIPGKKNWYIMEWPDDGRRPALYMWSEDHMAWLPPAK